MATEFEFLKFEDLIMADEDDLLENMDKMEYKETIKAVFSFGTGIEYEDYLNKTSLENLWALLLE